ncbi:hypothetical protein PtA15_1A253 [Puccinia triticina]|uniref:Uncharacterized protein n=1 Tax=Puccinia triticina TaxID=208348 RepID=A0ABY7CAK0_9BASI|nr:uncharacterized protein PtA15_1A253 [Puccinia triticina]WAQ80915.1 hypothetical protein PtA15_1A253 [Puccinia triticina]WAR51809.1 hypothetical protein PtB15_1B245 [Puccinia triticina]
MAPPYSTLPNTRPRISSPLTCELTFARQPDHLLIGHPNNAQQQPQPGQPTRTLLLCSAIDALLFIHLALQASRASNITKPSSTHQPRKPTSSFRQSNKARYQHLMNPF